MRKVGKVSSFKVSRFQGFKVSEFQGFNEVGHEFTHISGELFLGSPCSHLGMMRAGAVGPEALWVLHVISRRRVPCKDGQLVHDRTAFSLVILIVSLVFAMVRARSCPSDC